MKQIEDFITIEETSQLTGLTPKSLSNYRSRKVKFPFYKMGGQIWYKKSEILEIINNSRVSVSTEVQS
ncbi:MAG: helix-turn-helix domain-containing protein [Arcobacteraceae bacterium]|nr:helix-turn-helix domain-containing protein [Arcobacteraceae bacterium]